MHNQDDLTGGTTEAARAAIPLMRDFGLTMQEAAAATAELARIMRPIFVQTAREAWPYMTPERQHLLAWIWEETECSIN